MNDQVTLFEKVNLLNKSTVSLFLLLFFKILFLEDLNQSAS